MGVPLRSRIELVLSTLLIVAMAMMATVGCEDRQPAETTMFESAEVDLRQGNYKQAMRGYETFLEQYPDSPLAPTAEMRLRSIHREVSSVMERTGSPRPVYHGSNGEQSASTDQPWPPDSQPPSGESPPSGDSDG